MAIHNYFYGREHDDPMRSGAHYWYVGNGRLKGATEAGARLYLGPELEVGGFPTSSDAIRASDYVDEVLGRWCVCKSDASVSRGFEIVFDPMTLKAFMAIRPLIEQVLAELERRGGHSHDTDFCGLHVHTSRIAYGNDDDARLLAFGKLMTLTERFQAEFSAIARRDTTQSQWCRPTGYGHAMDDGSRAIRRKAKAVLQSQGALDDEGHYVSLHDGRRYHIWNFQNKPTVECRAFRGTLKASTLFATLAWVDGLVRWCTQHTTPETHAIGFADLIAWIGNDDLTAYVAERRRYVGRMTAYAA